MRNLMSAIFLFLFISVQLNGQKSFTFIFMSDLHYHEKNDAPRAMDIAIDTINKINPDFILVGGDIVYDVLRSEQEEAESLFQTYLAKSKKINAPIRYTVGNHEVFALYNQNVKETHPLFGKKMYEKYFGPAYYSFSHKGWHFIALDNIFITEERKYVAKVDSTQLVWLEKELEQVNDTTPIVMMAHVPMITTLSQWYGGGTRANTNRLANENTDDVLKLFKNKNLKLILQGHIHYFEALNILKKTKVISAPSFSGRWWLGKQNEMEEGFIQIDVKEDGSFDYKVIEYDWDSTRKRK